MNRKINYAIYGLIFWFLAFLVWEWSKSYPKVQWNPIPFPKTKAERLDSLCIQSLSDFLIPGLAIGIIEDGKVSYLKTFGYQNLESKDSLLLSSRIPVASVSKMFTALAISSHFSSQEISISKPIGELFPSNSRIPDFLEKITIEELLRHNSGLKDPGAFTKLLKIGSDRGLEKILPNIPPPNELKNEAFYADVNFDLAGWVLQEHSGVPFDSLVKSLTFFQAGMNSSSFVRKWPEIDNSISGYGRTFFWKRIEPKRLELERYPSPSSGLVTTPQDLSNALLHLVRGDLSDFSSELDWLRGEQDLPAGFQSIHLENQNFLGHFGEQAGYSSLFAFSVEKETGFFILTNAKDLQDHRVKIASSILHILSANP